MVNVRHSGTLRGRAGAGHATGPPAPGDHLPAPRARIPGWHATRRTLTLGAAGPLLPGGRRGAQNETFDAAVGSAAPDWAGTRGTTSRRSCVTWPMAANTLTSPYALTAQYRDGMAAMRPTPRCMAAAASTTAASAEPPARFPNAVADGTPGTELPVGHQLPDRPAVHDRRWRHSRARSRDDGEP